MGFVIHMSLKSEKIIERLCTYVLGAPCGLGFSTSVSSFWTLIWHLQKLWILAAKDLVSRVTIMYFDFPFQTFLSTIYFKVYWREKNLICILNFWFSSSLFTCHFRRACKITRGRAHDAHCSFCWKLLKKCRDLW